MVSDSVEVGVQVNRESQVYSLSVVVVPSCPLIPIGRVISLTMLSLSSVLPEVKMMLDALVRSSVVLRAEPSEWQGRGLSIHMMEYHLLFPSH